jgi:hypothetical protein
VELVGLALRQGVLYGQQLPKTPDPDTGHGPPRTLTQVLSNATNFLPPVRVEPVPVFDEALDDLQREAVAKALATPDICLIQGLPGTGKSRVSAEIIAQAVARGKRVLLLASTSMALDRILERLAPRDDILSVRCLEQGENADALPPAIASMTFRARLSSVNGKAQANAKDRAAELEQRLDLLRQAESIWPGLETLACQSALLNEQCRARERERAGIFADLEQKASIGGSAGALAGRIADRRRTRDEAWSTLDATLLDLKAQIAKNRQESTGIQSEIDELRALRAAQDARRWWTRAWWRAGFRSNLEQDLARLETEQGQLSARIESDEAQAITLCQRREAADKEFESERARLIAAEALPLQERVDLQLAEHHRQLGEIEREWRRLVSLAAPQKTEPKVGTLADVESVRRDWQNEVLQTEKELSFARQWAVHLDSGADPIASRFHEYVNLVAATAGALERDSHFGDSGSEGRTERLNFDLLILEEAEQISEAEFVKAAGRAERCVLVGEPQAGCDGDKAPGARAPASWRRPKFFQDLWHRLHCDPRRLPYEWFFEKDHLICRLHNISEDERRGLETERVADAPEIELRILPMPGAQPILAEIVFPGATPLDRAKQFVFTELEELAVRPGIQSLRWVETPEHIILRLAESELHHDVSVPVQPGLREMLGRRAPMAEAPLPPSCCLEFDRGEGWHRSRAEEWVAQHLGLRDLGRTARLDVLYRMDAGLGAFLADTVLHRHGPVPRSLETSPNGQQPVVEFIAVPPLGERERSGGSQPADSRNPLPAQSRTGGAGLDIDLTDARQRERLPAELRGGLPDKGYANYNEAQAVVRALHGVIEPHARAALRIGVIAPYPAQVELIRRLILSRPLLGQPHVAIEVGVPTAFRHREVDVVILSLTRSHTHRAVTFGEGPETLELALTRARSRLILIGDPGTLFRRSQWDGRVEHLDEASAARERELIGHLVRYIRGQGRHGQAFLLRSDSGT